MIERTDRYDRSAATEDDACRLIAKLAGVSVAEVRAARRGSTRTRRRGTARTTTPTTATPSPRVEAPEMPLTDRTRRARVGRLYA